MHLLYHLELELELGLELELLLKSKLEFELSYRVINIELLVVVDDNATYCIR